MPEINKYRNFQLSLINNVSVKFSPFRWKNTEWNAKVLVLFVVDFNDAYLLQRFFERNIINYFTRILHYIVYYNVICNIENIVFQIYSIPRHRLIRIYCLFVTCLESRNFLHVQLLFVSNSISLFDTKCVSPFFVTKIRIEFLWDCLVWNLMQSRRDQIFSLMHNLISKEMCTLDTLGNTRAYPWKRLSFMKKVIFEIRFWPWRSPKILRHIHAVDFVGWNKFQTTTLERRWF